MKIEQRLKAWDIRPYWHPSMGPLCIDSCPKCKKVTVPAAPGFCRAEEICSLTTKSVSRATYCGPAVEAMYKELQQDV